ncbi:MAG: hypothetical protein WD825_04305 [Gemmatimonadaceae bacterium]
MSRLCARGLAPAILLLLAACSAAPGARRSNAVDPFLITTEELQASRYTTAFQVVQSVRPQWLRLRGPTSLKQGESVKVYLDGSLLGGPEQLQQITTRSISSIRFLDGNEATLRWGLDHGQGALVVSTRREPR